jgi:RND family efflux transporter MFP subunit
MEAHSQTQPPQRNSTTRVFAIGALALVAGLAALIGVRVKETLADRKAMAEAVPPAGTANANANAPSNGESQRANVTHATPIKLKPRVAVTGTLMPIQEADVGFKTGGRLSMIKGKVGDVVKAGQLLAALDVSEASAQSAAASAGVKAAEVGLSMAKDANARVQALAKTSAVNDADRVKAEQSVALAEAQLAQARAQAQLAGTMVGNGTLSAPFGGLLTRAPAGFGKIVGPGEPMFHLEDTSVLKLNATVGEVDAKLVKVGSVIALDGSKAKGTITAVVGSLDPQTRRVPVIAELPNKDGDRLFSGSFVRVTIVTDDEISVLSLPQTALRPGSQDELVLAKDGKAHLVHVTLAPSETGALMVRAGLSVDDLVVLAPSPEITEGAPLAL